MLVVLSVTGPSLSLFQSFSTNPTFFMGELILIKLCTVACAARFVMMQWRVFN